MGVDSAANNKIMTKLLFSVFISGLLVVETPHQAVSLSVLMAVSLNSLKLHKYNLWLYSLCSTNSWILRGGGGVQILF